MERIKDYFTKNDRFAAGLAGASLEEVAPGYARCVLQVEDKHLNGAGVVHGGAVFTLADLAFGAAANTRGQLALGINASITWIKAAGSGTLTAEANEINASGRLGVYEVIITDEQQDKVAVFQGTVYRKNTPFPA